MGVDILWRNRAVGLTDPNPGDKVCDMCCGTGDLTGEFLKTSNSPAEIVGCDFSEEMIELAKKKFRDKPIAFSVQDCTSTNFQNEYFDIVSCAFGVRNLKDLDAGLHEMNRILKPEGKICILEFSLPTNKLIRCMYLLYFKYVLPVIGGIITFDMSAYRYFVKSVIDWNNNTDLKEKLKEKGFETILKEPLTFGIATIHIAQKK